MCLCLNDSERARAIGGWKNEFLHSAIELDEQGDGLLESQHRRIFSRCEGHHRLRMHPDAIVMWSAMCWWRQPMSINTIGVIARLVERLRLTTIVMNVVNDPDRAPKEINTPD
jgi:hypothetical protein